MVSKLDWNNNMCSSCFKSVVTKYGLMCDACASAYEGVNIKGDNESEWLRKRP